ncbi:hypothetical protein OG948_55485 (plasmid) [Embleya sp. NBC_00888]|uniref:tetratricopeptide repeat protein n=1 Tax=Embleya sp. NBC_00888 TaxID=2975960 RepID=UPI002F9095F8|nr:hypothetical protein OG948_55485 [Embleya sp. NBC_00888]
MGTDERSTGDDSRDRSHAGESAAECFARCLRELHQAAGSPAHAELIRRGLAHKPPIRLKAASLSDWFTGRSTPTARSTQLAFLLGYLEKAADNRAPGRQSTPPERWRQLRGLAEDERRTARQSPPGNTEPDRTGHVPAAVDDEPDARADSRAAGVGYAGDHIDSGHATFTGPELHRTIGAPEATGRPVREFTNPFALEVHRAIDAPEHRRSTLPVLPVYVPRAHDRILRAAVERAAGGESTMVTLVAGSSTGKTRACWEALQHVPDGWRLWHPLHPSPAEAAADLSRVGRRTVIWLNEAQTYLEPAGLGQQIATGLRELLHDPERGPVLVLATLWLDPYWHNLTTIPAPGSPDPHEQARKLLVGTEVTVPEAFTGADLDAARKRADNDPRLAQALSSGGDGRITQFLAGAPALLARYAHAPAHARAVIEAAMDVRRLGHGPVLRQAFLEDAAEAYLTDHESDTLTDDWFEKALEYAAARVHGTVAPLTRIRPRRRDHGGPDEGVTYRLADYLEQHARLTRRTHCPGASFWNAAHDHAQAPDDLLNLAEAAHRRLRLRHAEHLYSKVAVAQDPRGLGPLTGLRERAGDHEGAERLARQAADAGDADPLKHLADLRRRAGDQEGAERLAGQAADAENTKSPKQSAGPGAQAGNLNDAERSALKRAATKILVRLIAWRERAGDHKGAERMAHRAADAGNVLPLALLITLRERAGDHEGAERLARQAADAGDTDLLKLLIALLEGVGDHDGAERLVHEAADAGNTDPLILLITLREQAGNHDGAERLTRQALGAGKHDPLTLLITLRRQAGDHEGAERLARQAADAGDTDLLTLLITLLEGPGGHDSAERLAREAADAGDTNPLTLLITLRERAGNHDGAERLAREAADAGDTDLPKLLITLREQAGDHDGAERLARQAADTGDTDLLTLLITLRERAGDHDGMERLVRAAAEGGNRLIRGQLDVLRGQVRDREGAERLAHRAADAGDTLTLTLLAMLRNDVGDHEGAERLRAWLHRGFDTDGASPVGN